MRISIRKRSSRRSEEGSVFIEMLFFVPVVVLIWILLSFVHQAKRTAVVTQRDARECMWEYATNGCRGGLSSACQSAGAGVVPDFALRAAGDFESVAGDVPITAPNVIMLHGRYAGVSTERDVRRPSVLGGNTTATGRMSVMCGEDPIVKWVTEPIYQVICNQHGKAEWCN